MKSFIRTSILLFALSLSGCGDKGSSQQSASTPASPPALSNPTANVNSSQSSDVSESLNGVISFKIVQLKNFIDDDRCEVFIEAKNNATSTLSMGLDITFKTKEGQVIESVLKGFRVRGGQTITTYIPAHEKCHVVGAMAITKTMACEVDGNNVDVDVCWNSLSPVPGVLPLVK